MSARLSRTQERRSGNGATAWLQCPDVSQALTPKKTLSFDIGIVTELFPVVAPYLEASAAYCQSEAVVSRHTIW